MKILSVLFFIILYTSCTTKYYIVRHAEKVDNTEQSVLTKEGIRRAADLGDYFINNGIKIDSIYTSDAIRTVLTGAPTSLNFRINTETVKQRDQNILNAFVERLKKISKRKVLIVSHSNVIPNLIQKLSGLTIRDIKEDEYDNLYILSRKGNDWTLEHTLYGKVKLTTDLLHAEQPIK
jgi:2,3-bisphosphoglycerate-dependent phosphoglycerate mutase